jgi:hypothetical protein
MKKFLIPKHEGSLSNYYHFLIGYLLPIIDTLSNDTDKSVKYVVRDCGPMNIWFERLKIFYNVEVLDLEKFLGECLDSENKIIFDYYDDPKFFNNRNMKEILKKLKWLYSRDTSNHKNENIGVLTRSFAKTNISLFTRVNNKPRFIENTKELIDIINKNVGNCTPIDTSEDNCESIINTYNNLKILIGQWGAGLTNLVWMPPNSTIIQIMSKDKLNANEWENCYRDLAKLLNHNFILVEAQENWTGPVDIEKILDCFKK